jgi:hypothetical protein
MTMTTTDPTPIPAGVHRAADLKPRCTSVRDLPHLVTGGDFVCELGAGHPGTHLAHVGGDGCAWDDQQARPEGVTAPGDDDPVQHLERELDWEDIEVTDAMRARWTKPAPVWLNTAVIPAGLVDDLVRANSVVEQLVQHVLAELMNIEHVVSRYRRAERAAGFRSGEVGDRIDDVSGFTALDDWLRALGDFVTRFIERADPVEDALRPFLRAVETGDLEIWHARPGRHD